MALSQRLFFLVFLNVGFVGNVGGTPEVNPFSFVISGYWMSFSSRYEFFFMLFSSFMQQHIVFGLITRNTGQLFGCAFSKVVYIAGGLLLAVMIPISSVNNSLPVLFV